MAAKGVMRSLGLYVSLCKRGGIGCECKQGPLERGGWQALCWLSHGGR